MSRPKHLWRRIVRRQRVEADLDAEVRAYFDILTERGIAQGLTREEAQRAARLRFGGVAQVKARVREARVGSAIEATLQDVRYGWRMLAKSPGFTCFAVLTIALALGANAAIFSFVDGMLFKPSGYPEADRIVQLWETRARGGRHVIAPANYVDWSRQSRSFTAMAARAIGTMSYMGDGEPQPVRVGFVSAPYFDVFGLTAVLGRTFVESEDRQGHEKVVVISHRSWRNLLGAERGVIGRNILLNGEPYTVVGVLPEESPFDRHWVDLWAPLVLPADAARDYHYLSAFARLKRGVSIDQARAEMHAMAARLAQSHPAVNRGWGATVDRYLDRLIGPKRRFAAIVLMAAVASVLLIGCANLTNLLLARATLRSREMAVRMALGAGRVRLMRMLLTESVLLSAGGAALGLVLGYGLLRWIQRLLPPFVLPPEVHVSMDGRVLLFLAAITILTSLACGLAPAMQTVRGDAADAIKEGRTISTGRRAVRARQIFIAAQVAVVFILLVGGGLLIRSLQQLMTVDVGFVPEGVMSASLPLPVERDPNPSELTQYITRLLDEVCAVPGVQAAAVTTALPLGGWGNDVRFRLPGEVDRLRGTGFKIVTPGYFHALGLRLVAGRLLDERDTAGSAPVVVVNESFAERYFENDAAVGQRMLVQRILPSRHALGPELSWQVVGVVADEKANGLERSSDVGVYASFLQNPVVGLGLVAKGRGDAASLIKPIQQAVWNANKHQTLLRPRTMEQVMAEDVMPRRLLTVLMAGFGALAMFLACAGIYGLLAFVTARRTQELGIRAALGATRSVLMYMVVAGGAKPVLVGIGVGLLGAIPLARFVRTILFETSPLDVPTLLRVTTLFLMVAVLSCVVPAWRAVRIDPMSALRRE